MRLRLKPLNGNKQVSFTIDGKDNQELVILFLWVNLTLFEQENPQPTFQKQ